MGWRFKFDGIRCDTLDEELARDVARDMCVKFQQLVAAGKTKLPDDVCESPPTAAVILVKADERINTRRMKWTCIKKGRHAVTDMDIDWGLLDIARENAAPGVTVHCATHVVMLIENDKMLHFTSVCATKTK